MKQKPNSKEKRTLISRKEIENAITEFTHEIYAQLDKKGYGTYSSIHEIFGSLSEEFYEVEAEVHKDNHDAMKKEMYQIAVAAVFGSACINSETLDW